jgi:hypothetical protein
MGTAAAQSSRPALVWALTLDDPGAIVRSTWSPTGTCVAAVTDSTVHVIDPAGRAMWAWRFREASRFLHPSQFPSAFALSPECDVVVLGGWSDYKYVWTADRRGRRSFFRTSGTPFHAKFNLRSDTIAVTTGGEVAYLLSPRLKVRWSGTIADLPVRWPGQTGNSEAMSAEFQKADVEKLFDVPWGYGTRDSVSDDGQWRAVAGIPIRGPGVGELELWGPAADGYRDRFKTSGPGVGFLAMGGNPRESRGVNSIGDRRPRWKKDIGCPDPTISRDGLFVVVSGDLDHPAYVSGGNDTCDGSPPTYVFDRDGNTVLTWPYDGNRDEMADAVFARTGVRLRLSERPRWDMYIPARSEEPNTASEITQTYSYSPDGSALLVTRGRILRLYRIPQ